MSNKNPHIELTFLGTGTSTGIPLIACDCHVCTSSDPRDKRLRTSAMLTIDGKNYVFDSGPDFRSQMLRENVTDLEAIIFTHEHRDHIAGLDDVRAFNYLLNKRIDIFGNSKVMQALEREFPYIFNNTGYLGAPQINTHIIENTPFPVDENIRMQPIKAWHNREMSVLGFRVGDLTYITDAKFIEEEELEKAKGSRILVLNALRKSRHISHLSLEEAIELAEKISPEQTYFTHMSHFIGRHAEVEQELPPGIHLAYDGLKVKI